MALLVVCKLGLQPSIVQIMVVDEYVEVGGQWGHMMGPLFFL